MKGTVQIAYWDTEQGAQPPALLGQIKGTPTIRLFKPKKKGKKKAVIDYNGERKTKEMRAFVEAQMPSFVEKVNGAKDLSALKEKAEKYGLPQALLFTSKTSTSPLSKFMSTEFRLRMLLAEVTSTKTNKDVIEKYGITDFPALVLIPAAAEGGSGDEVAPIKYEDESFSRHRLHLFFSKHALKEAIPLESAKKKKDPPPEKKSKREHPEL